MSSPTSPAPGIRHASPKQLDALRAVAAGRVTYGDPHPAMLARRHARAAGTSTRDVGGRVRVRPTSLVAYARSVWLLDGHEVYGGQHVTYGSLDLNGWVVAGQRDDYGPASVMLTEAGTASLERRSS